MRFRTKTAQEVRAMHQEMTGGTARAALPAAEDGTATPEARSPLRVKFEANLYRWSEARPREAERLANKLSIWASAYPEYGTTWALLEKRLLALAVEKDVRNYKRPRDQEARKGNTRLAAKHWTSETVVDWLFESPIADEWMHRLTQRF